MQVILKQNVARVGRYLDVVEVSNGYANNFLIPQKLAEPATKAKIAQLEKMREALKGKEEARMKELSEKIATIGETPLVLTVKADDQGNLYKKIHASDIALALKNERDISIVDSALLVDVPFEKVGEYTVPCEYGDIKADILVHIVKEEKK